MYAIICWLLLAIAQCPLVKPSVTYRFTIGAVLSSKQSREYFLQEIDNIQKDLGPNVNLRARTVPMHPNPIQTANEVCTKLIPHQVHTVVVSHLPDLLTNQTTILTDHNSASSVSFTCGFLGVPVISISNRNSALSDKQLHRTFLRTVPAFTNQAKIWLHLLRRLRYNNFILIHRADQEGLSALSKVNEMAHKLKMQMETVIAFEEIFSNVRTTSRSHAEEDAMFESIFKGGNSPAAGADQSSGGDGGYIPAPSIASHDNQFSYNASQLRSKFENVLRSTNCRVFLLYANTAEEAMYVIRVAKGLNMFSPGFVWILSEQSLTAPSLMGAQLSDLPEGALAVRLSTKASDERRHIRDAVTLITKAIKKLTKMDASGISSSAPPSNCNTTSYQNWTLGAQMLQLLRNEKLENGTTGRLAFDYKGDRLETDYDIVNIQHSVVNNTIVRVKKIVGQHFYSVLANGTSLAVNITDIIWPGGVKDQPLGYFVPTHLNIVTLPEQPFVETRRVYPKDDVEGQEKNKQKGLNFDLLNPLSGSINQVKMSHVINDSLHFSTPEFYPETDLNKNYSQHPNWTPDALLIKRSTSKLQYLCKVNEVHCPHYNESTGHTKHYCCSGYCIDLLLRVADALNFTFNLYQVSDLSYGSKKYLENRIEWNGLIGELLSKRADMAIATLTINPERAKVIDFSKPYKYEGIAMLQLRVSKGARLASFLQPFQGTLWFLVLFSVYVVALVLYLLDRFSPFGQFVIKYTTENDACTPDNQTRAPNAVQHAGQNGELKRKASALSGPPTVHQEKEFSPGEKPLTLSGAIWFSWGVLLNSGIGEKTPRSFSARVLGMIWAGFAMIVVASYTANLAAFLVLDSTETQIQGLEDARLRNPAEGFTYGTVQNSAVDLYFRGQVVLSNMYRLMEENNRPTAQEAIDAVKNGDMNVFFWDSPRLEYEASRDCDLVISGETFGRSGYGIALQKNSFWTERVTLQLLRLIESGFMETLDNKWILRTDKRCDKYLESSFPTTLGLENMAGVFILVGAGILASCGCIFIEIAYKRRRLNRLRALTSAKRCALKWRQKVKQRRLEKEFGDLDEKPIDKDAKLDAKQYPSESRPTTVTPTSASTKHPPPSRPTGFSNQIYPAGQYPMAYLPSQSPVYPYTIEGGVQELRMASAKMGPMRAHPISSTSTLTSPNLGQQQQMPVGKVKGAPGTFGINQLPVAAAYARSAPSTQQVAKPKPGPPVKLKRADMYIATRHKEDLNYFELPPCPPPPTQKLSQRAFRQ